MRSRRRWRSATLASAALLAVFVACTQQPRPTVLGPGVPAATDEPRPSRRLFRMSYQGPQGNGNLRLALFLERLDRYQLRASDPLGRALWSLELADGSVHVLDHRRQEVCSTEAEVRIPEVALAPLPLAELPAVLLGRLPAAPVSGDRPVAGGEPFLDSRGRRWSAAYSTGGELQSWVLWEQDRPSLWWRSSEKGGILSHREGSQFRWRQTVEEPLVGALTPLETPAGYRETTCGGWVAAGS